MHECTADTEALSFVEVFHMGARLGSDSVEEAHLDVPAVILVTPFVLAISVPATQSRRYVT